MDELPASRIASWLRFTPAAVGLGLLVLIVCAWRGAWGGCHTDLWWISLALQAVGLCVSVGVLTLSAIESGLQAPHRALKKLFSKRTGPDQHQGPSAVAQIGISGSAAGSVVPDPTFSDAQKIEWLIRTQNASRELTDARLNEIDDQLEKLDNQVDEIGEEGRLTSRRLDEKIKGLGRANFYQVVIGLMLLSSGSIVSLFIEACQP